MGSVFPVLLLPHNGMLLWVGFAVNTICQNVIVGVAEEFSIHDKLYSS
jgi:hypothetical protein